MRAGDQWETNVPIGRYEMRYAIGRGWYGRECRFGSETKHREADKVLVFSQDGNTVRGHEVELIKQYRGNLGEVALAPSEF